MKISMILGIVFVSATVASAAPLNQADPGVQVKAYLEAQGHPDVVPRVVVRKGIVEEIHMNCPVPIPVEWPDYSVVKLPLKDRKLVSGEWVAKTPADLNAADIAVNGGAYAFQNAFLLLCDTAAGTNTHEKLAFETLPPVLKAIKKGGNKALFEDLRDAFNTVNQALIKKAGINWWDTCVWNTNAAVMANGQAIYDGLMAP